MTPTALPASKIAWQTRLRLGHTAVQHALEVMERAETSGRTPALPANVKKILKDDLDIGIAELQLARAKLGR